MRPWAWTLLLASLPAWLPARAAAVNAIEPPAAEFPAGDVWLNAKPLPLSRLKNRRAVLLAFINLANLNSLRALRVLMRLHEAYEFSGLMVIGVHTPLYGGFQKDPLWLRRRLKELGVEFPVVMDDDRRIWTAYANDGWPAFYLIDRKSRVAFSLLGEQRYAELETEARRAAEDAGYRLPSEELVSQDPPSVDCGEVSSERAAISTAPLVAIDSDPDVGVLTSQREGELSKRGLWEVDNDALKLRQRNASLEASLRVIYRGSQAFAVLAPALGQRTRFYLRQDGLWLHTGNTAADVEFDDDGRSYVVVSEPGLYELTRNPNDIFHALDVSPKQPGAKVYSFSFSDRCLRYEP